MEAFWFAGFLFTIGFIDFIGKDETAAKVGWKVMVVLFIANFFLFIFCLVAWPVVLGQDIKKTMKGEDE